MNHYLFDPQAFQKYYNCSYYDVNLHPIEERRDVLYGIILILGAIIFEILYFMVIPVLWQSHFLEQTCYQLMAIISVIDVVAISLNGILSGYFAIIGAVYCTNPDIMFWAGPHAVIFWHIESCLALILALNRCLAMINIKLCDRVFSTTFTYFLVSLSFIYSVIFAIGTNAHSFSSIYGIWLLNPHMGYPQNGYEYNNVFHDIHNIIIAFSLAILYTIFIGCLCKKRLGSSGTFSFPDKPIFVQVFFMSFMNFTCALIYVYEMHYLVPKLIMQFSQFGWMCIHGFPSIIYLVFNKSIRRRVLKMTKLQTRIVSTTAFAPPNVSNNKNNSNM